MSTTKTLIEKRGSQTIYRCDTNVPIPAVDLLTLLFGTMICRDTLVLVLTNYARSSQLCEQRR